MSGDGATGGGNMLQGAMQGAASGWGGNPAGGGQVGGGSGSTAPLPNAFQQGIQGWQQSQDSQRQAQHQVEMDNLKNNPMGKGLHTLLTKMFGKQQGSQFTPTTGPMPPSGGDIMGGEDPSL